MSPSPRMYTGKPGRRPDPSSRGQRMLALLAIHGPLTLRQIRDALDLDPTAFKNAFSALQREGKIVAVDHVPRPAEVTRGPLVVVRWGLGS